MLSVVFGRRPARSSPSGLRFHSSHAFVDWVRDRGGVASNRLTAKELHYARQAVQQGLVRCERGKWGAPDWFWPIRPVNFEDNALAADPQGDW